MTLAEEQGYPSGTRGVFADTIDQGFDALVGAFHVLACLRDIVREDRSAVAMCEKAMDSCDKAIISLRQIRGY